MFDKKNIIKMIGRLLGGGLKWLDLSTLVVGCCWVGMLLLWTGLGGQEREPEPRYKSMVIAYDMRLSDEDIYRRPDLVAMPSSVSFVPDLKDVENVIVSIEKDPYTSILKREPLKAGSVVNLDKVALAAEAIRDLGGDKIVRSEGAKVVRPQGTKKSSPVLVCASGTIGDNVVLSWTDSDYTELFSGSKSWEIEVSLVISDKGLPESVFLEKTSGDGLIDRGVVRVLSRYDLWQNALPGYGSVLINFSPRS